MEVVASLSQGRTAAAQCGLFTHKSVPVIFEPPCIILILLMIILLACGFLSTEMRSMMWNVSRNLALLWFLGLCDKRPWMITA